MSFDRLAFILVFVAKSPTLDPGSKPDLWFKLWIVEFSGRWSFSVSEILSSSSFLSKLGSYLPIRPSSFFFVVDFAFVVGWISSFPCRRSSFWTFWYDTHSQVSSVRYVWLAFRLVLSTRHQSFGNGESRIFRLIPLIYPGSRGPSMTVSLFNRGNLFRRWLCLLLLPGWTYHQSKTSVLELPWTTYSVVLLSLNVPEYVHVDWSEKRASWIQIRDTENFIAMQRNRTAQYVLVNTYRMYVVG